MKWKFCQCCFLDGHCENQDRGHKCETYPKQLEDKLERLQEQLKEANEVIKDYDGFTAEITPDGKYAFKIANSARLYLEKWGVK